MFNIKYYNILHYLRQGFLSNCIKFDIVNFALIIL